MVRESTETPNTESRLSDDRDNLTLVSKYSPAGDQGAAIAGEEFVEVEAGHSGISH